MFRYTRKAGGTALGAASALLSSPGSVSDRSRWIDAVFCWAAFFTSPGAFQRGMFRAEMDLCTSVNTGCTMDEEGIGVAGAGGAGCWACKQAASATAKPAIESIERGEEGISLVPDAALPFLVAKI